MLSIVSWVFCPLIPSIVALVLASSADQEIRNSGGRIGGEGLSKAAKIISWINIAVSVVGIIGFFALIGFATTEGPTY